MPTCYAPLCKSGYASNTKRLKAQGLPLPHFFTPSTEEQRARWEMIIKRKDAPLLKTSRVCSEHFTPDQISLFFETKMPDGTTQKIPRDRAKLKEGADPSIFPEYPKYYQPKTKTRKSPRKKVLQNTQIKKIPVLHEENPVVDNGGLVLGDEHGDVHGDDHGGDQVDDAQNTSSEPHQHDKPFFSFKTINFPPGWAACESISCSDLNIVHINENIQIDKSITLKSGESGEKVEIKVSGKNYDMAVPTTLDTGAVKKLISQLDIVKICQGTGIENKKFSVFCTGGFTSAYAKRCNKCHAERERLRKLEKRKEGIKKRQKEKLQKHKMQKQSLKRSNIKLLVKVARYRRQIDLLQMECANKKKEAVEEAIKSLPKPQQEAVRACFDAAKRKGPSGRRFTAAWVYECLLMRIKDRKLYEHIRSHEILVLPCASTIRGYLKHYGGTFGFQPQTLELMKTKAEDMEPNKRRGMILIDEMSLTKGVYFDHSILKMGGFKDMGESNRHAFGPGLDEEVDAAMEKLPEDQRIAAKIKRRQKKEEANKNKRDRNLGDHALVITFQPFMGTWVQPIGCFLTRGNANDDELTALILEAIILLERSSYFVDGVVTDGASWNRAMWTKFGVTESNASAEHPCDEDETRRLWFISDYPHLMKCMRNMMVEKKIIRTPEGDINLDHWKAIVEADKTRQVGLRECHKLTSDHLAPNPWQKMNVRMAWQFWSASCSAAMQSYRLQGMEKLQDCETSSKVCKLVNDLADTMNSNRPLNALTLDSPQFKVIDEFLNFFINLKEWANKRLRDKLEEAEKTRMEQMRKQGKRPRGKNIADQQDLIFSEPTDIGLIVTLKAAKELVTFLIEKCHFRYVMTARLNQDALERFFGLVRQSCGGNSHPEPRVFAQLFRLLSVYSLVKPMRGSNITGGEMVTTLINLEDLNSKTREERKEALSRKLDEILLNGEDLEHIPELIESVEHDHNYIGEGVDEFALSYVGGFVARHAKRYVTNECSECLNSLKKTMSESTDVDLLITLKSKGYLTYPSDVLISLLRQLEEKVITTALQNELEENILFVVLEKMENIEVTKIGCELHKMELTKSIMKFFLITRMHFLARRWNERNREDKKKQQAYRKQAHLT